ncbi:ribonuclease HII [bacterium]|nr:ribonuclease HII [bacterium]
MEKIKPAIRPVKYKKNYFENAAWKAKNTVCGVDEVGRGCLAGPLVTGAVILPAGSKHPLLKDSKILTEKERLCAYNWIIKNSWYSIGIVNSKTIDQKNIWQATLIAMKKAVLQLLATCPQDPTFFLIDAMPLKLSDTDYKNIPIIHAPKGESWSCSIAAASIVAKVTRDRLMKVFDPLFPGYNLTQHKGYGTKKHREAIQRLGATIIHRKSFLKNILKKEKDESNEQQTLF